MALIDPDDPSTWPAETREYIHDLSLIRDLDDGRGHHEDDDSLRLLLSGHLVLAHHATRLLDTEIRAIEEFGLKPLGEDLIQYKFSLLIKEKIFSSVEVDQLRVNAHRMLSPDEHRIGLTGITFGTADFKDADFSHSGNFQQFWGGEYFFAQSIDKARRNRFLRIGTPCLIKLGVDISKHEDIQLNSVTKSFISTLRMNPVTSSGYILQNHTACHKVLEVLTPHSSEYRTYLGLVVE